MGDGLNDAPVLSLADASFAVAGATDLARTQADFVIVGGDLHAVTMQASMTEANFNGKQLGESGAIIVAAFLPKCQ